MRTRLPNLTLQARQQAFLVYVRLSLLLLRATRGLQQRAVTASQSQVGVKNLLVQPSRSIRSLQLARKLKIPALALADSDGPQVLKLGLPGARWGWMQNLAAQNFAVSPLDSRAMRVVWDTCVAFDDCEFGRDGLRMSKSAYAKVRDCFADWYTGAILTRTPTEPRLRPGGLCSQAIRAFCGRRWQRGTGKDVY